MTRVRHECYTNETGATRVKKVDFDNDTSKNIFLHPYTYYMADERLQREEQFHSGATRVKKFDFHNDTSKNIFLHPYTYYMASERLQREEQFHSKN